MCMYRISRLLFSNSCTIIFPFCINAFFIHALHSSTVAPLHFIYHSCAAVMYRIRYIAFMRRTHYSFMCCTHFSFIHCTNFSFMHCTHFSFMCRTHFSFMRRISTLPMYHIHSLMVTSLFLPFFIYQVELLAP